MCVHKWKGTGNALVPTSCGNVSYCWSVFEKYVLRQQNVTLRLLLLLNRHPQLGKGKGPMVRGAHHLNAAFVASLGPFA